MEENHVVLFLDALEDDDAYVVLGERRFILPRAILPSGAREGSWLRLALDTNLDLDREIETRRARLLQSDPGGDIKL